MAHPDDRRAFAITLTDKARELLPALEGQSHAMEDEVTATLHPASGRRCLTCCSGWPPAWG